MVKKQLSVFGILLLESPCSFFRLSFGGVFFENVKFMLNVKNNKNKKSFGWFQEKESKKIFPIISEREREESCHDGGSINLNYFRWYEIYLYIQYTTYKIYKIYIQPGLTNICVLLVYSVFSTHPPTCLNNHLI